MAEELAQKLSNQMVLTSDEAEGVEAPEEAWVNINFDPNLTLVGKLLAKRGKPLKVFVQVMTTSWGIIHGFEVKNVNDDRMLFVFKHAREAARVMAGGPWSFDKNLLLLSTLAAGDDPVTKPLNFVEFHIQVEGVPFGMINPAMAKAIGDGVGSFVAFDEKAQENGFGSVMRLRASIDVTKPLKRALKVRNSKGEAIVVTFRYERLPNFCYQCGVLGHILKECRIHLDVEAVHGEVDESSLDWGDWLRASNNPHNGRLIGGGNSTIRPSRFFVEQSGRDDIDRRESEQGSAGNGKSVSSKNLGMPIFT